MYLKSIANFPLDMDYLFNHLKVDCCIVLSILLRTHELTMDTYEPTVVDSWNFSLH